MKERIAEIIGDGVFEDWPSDLIAEAVLDALMEPSAWVIDEMCGARWKDQSQGKLGEQMIACYQAAIRAMMSDEVGNPETQAMITVAKGG